jgi:hypothetical protein
VHIASKNTTTSHIKNIFLATKYFYIIAEFGILNGCKSYRKVHMRHMVILNFYNDEQIFSAPNTFLFELSYNFFAIL